MKKILTIVLALVMVLALAVPAMAFTGTTTASSTTAPKLSIYLVDYSDSGFFGLATLPAADRGYAKNEIVAAIVELAVLKGTDMSGYGTLAFSGTNATLNVTDNTPATVKTVGDPAPAFTLSSDGYTLTRTALATNLTAATADTTYKWLFFAKVQADAAVLTAKLTDGAGIGSAFAEGTLTLVLGGVPYTVTKTAVGTTGYTYGVAVGGTGTYAGASFVLSTDSNYKTTGMSIDPAGAAIASQNLGVTVGGVLGYVSGASVVTSATDATYTAVMNVYNDVVKGVFGLDYFKIGNYLYDSFFTGFTSAKTITASVAIKPWTAYVTVPSTTVVTPPKTGDAAGIMGFVMIVLAAAAAVVVKKVRA